MVNPNQSVIWDLTFRTSNKNTPGNNALPAINFNQPKQNLSHSSPINASHPIRSDTRRELHKVSAIIECKSIIHYSYYVLYNGTRQILLIMIRPSTASWPLLDLDPLPFSRIMSHYLRLLPCLLPPQVFMSYPSLQVGVSRSAEMDLRKLE